MTDLLVQCPACHGAGSLPDDSECEECGGCGDVVSEDAFPVLYPLAGYLACSMRDLARAVELESEYWQEAQP